MGGTGIKAGKRVRVEGLAKSPQYNNQEAVVVRQEADKWLIKLEDKEMLLKADNLVPIEAPAVKKARFAAEPEEVTIEDSEDSEEDGDEEENEDPPFSTWANNAITIRMITGPGEDGEICSFNPLFTHQVFFTKATPDAESTNEELIIGYENPQVEIVYAANNLKPWMDFKNDEMVPMKDLKAANLTRTNVLSAILKAVPCDYATKRSAVEAHASEDFKPLGECLHSEKKVRGM